MFRPFYIKEGEDMFKYISVKEFAIKAGVSPQAIYQRIDKDLKKFSRTKQGKKTISEAALDLFLVNENSLVENFKKSRNLDQGFNEKIVNSLLSQLEIKDCQIAEKDRQIAEKDIQLKELTAALINEQKSAQQAHALHAGTMQQTSMLETRGNQPKLKLKQRFKWFKKQKGGTLDG